MKKLTFFAAAFLVAATSFAQTTTTSGTPETKSKTTHGTTVSAAAKANVSSDVTTAVTGKGEAMREVAKAKADKAKARKEETSTALKDELTSQKDAAKARKEDLKAKKEETKNQTEQTGDATAQAKADLKAKAKAQREENQETYTQSKADLKLKSKAEVEVSKQELESHGDAVSNLATETITTGREKGQLIKEAASEKRQRAGRVETKTGVAVKAGSTNARRANVTTGLSTKGLKPVKVHAATNLNIGRN
jgi:colicin import membrane protein